MVKLFKLRSVNRVLRLFGLLMVIEVPTDAEDQTLTTVYITTVKRYAGKCQKRAV